jgi:hypothetical protein
VKPVPVTLHAHPDDEAIFTGGTIVRAVEAGWRVVVIVATEGDRGRYPGNRIFRSACPRRAETLAAASILGVERVDFLGCGDSGHDEMPGRHPNARIASARGLQSGTLAGGDGGRRREAVTREVDRLSGTRRLHWSLVLLIGSTLMDWRTAVPRRGTYPLTL